MKALKPVVITSVIYVAIVVAFESLLGYFQPEAGATMSITTYDEEGVSHDRVVARLESDGVLYVAVNHWPRAWYRRLLRNPQVSVTWEGQNSTYSAQRISGTEYDRVNSEHGLPFVFRLLTGFPRRHILRLEPVN